MTQLNVLELLDATQQFEQKLNLALTYYGLRLPQFRAIHFLEKAGKITVTDLSRHLNVTRATVSVLINELLKAGIVESVAHNKDKRSFYIVLTESGLQRLSVARKAIAIVEETISKEFSHEQIAALNNFSGTVRLS